MGFHIFTDSSANLPYAPLARQDVGVIPFSYFAQGEERCCTDIDAFDGERYYGDIRSGLKVSTSQINPQRYTDYMRPVLAGGEDVLYVGMSSGISGAYACAELAAEELRQEFPERRVRLVDTLSASLGEGLLALRAVECREQGMSLDETARLLLTLRRRMCQVFTVDDLMHLRRSGRLSNLAAAAGMVLHIKPLLKGDEEGRIVTFGKALGRRRAIEALREKYDALALAPEEQTVGIAHAGCPAEAERLKTLLLQNRPPRDVLTVCYEPVTGSHVGPGALALFFLSRDDVRSAF